MFEWRKSVHYWWSYILFSPECKELTSMLDPLLYRWGVPPIVIRCVHWTMQIGVLQTWIKAQDIFIVMACLPQNSGHYIQASMCWTHLLLVPHTGPSLIQVMAWRISGAKTLPEQCWNIVKWTLRKKLQWNFILYSNIFIQENAFESVVCQKGGHFVGVVGVKYI